MMIDRRQWLGGAATSLALATLPLDAAMKALSPDSLKTAQQAGLPTDQTASQTDAQAGRRDVTFPRFAVHR